MIIDQTTRMRAWEIWKISQTEPKYREMLLQIRTMENAYEEALSLLPKEQEAAVRDYISQCEAMSWRMLQIACAVMAFPGEENR